MFQQNTEIDIDFCIAISVSFDFRYNMTEFKKLKLVYFKYNKTK